MRIITALLTHSTDDAPLMEQNERDKLSLSSLSCKIYAAKLREPGQSRLAGIRVIYKKKAGSLKVYG
jgi:hypothetical protein